MPVRRVPVALTAFALAVASIPVLVLASAEATPAGDEGRLAFESTRDGLSDIFVANPDGSAPVNVSNAPGAAVDPAWSPDGSRIAYSTGGDVYVVAADGTDPVNLTPGPNDGQGNTGVEPAWSPDGLLISYSDAGEIWTMAPDGSDKQNLTGNGAAAIEREHAWSPDGRTIAMVRDQSLWLLDVASGEATPLYVPTQGSVKSPDFAPDGEHLVFEASGALWTIAASGGAPVKILESAVSPQWSPDGARIVFASSNAGYGAQNGLDVFSVKVDGQDVRRLTGVADATDTDPARQGVTRGADLAVAISSSHVKATVDQPEAFTVSVHNRGPETARLAGLRTTVPRGTTYVSATGPAGACARKYSYISCRLGSIAPNGTVEVRVVVTPTTVHDFVLSAAVVSSNTDPYGRDNQVEIHMTVAGPVSAEPLPFLSWYVPQRVRDRDGDGVVDEELFTSTEVPPYEMTIDGCKSSTGGLPATYAFEVRTPTGAVLTRAASPTCTFDINPPVEGGYLTELTMTTAEGSFTVTKTIPFRDFFVVSLGDSVASGEGNPDVPCVGGCHINKPPVRWQNRRCHRSAKAGPSVAARLLETYDATTSVTFVHLACSGAQVTEGITQGYAGMEDQDQARIPPQVKVLKSLMTAWKRKPDAVMVSIGANDAQFADVVMACLLPTRCYKDQDLRKKVERNLAKLPGRYKMLNAALQDLGIPSRKVFITEYFDPTRDQRGKFADCLLTPNEWEWAEKAVVAPLNAHVRDAANRYGWNMVGGVAAAFRTHGSCSTTSWVRTIGDSFDMQGHEQGAFHPTEDGQFLYADLLYKKLVAALY